MKLYCSGVFARAIFAPTCANSSSKLVNSVSFCRTTSSFVSFLRSAVRIVFIRTRSLSRSDGEDSRCLTASQQKDAASGPSTLLCSHIAPCVCMYAPQEYWNVFWPFFVYGTRYIGQPHIQSKMRAPSGLRAGSFDRGL